MFAARKCLNDEAGRRARAGRSCRAESHADGPRTGGRQMRLTARPLLVALNGARPAGVFRRRRRRMCKATRDRSRDYSLRASDGARRSGTHARAVALSGQSLVLIRSETSSPAADYRRFEAANGARVSLVVAVTPGSCCRHAWLR